MIISFILMTLMFDLWVILWGEIRCWSLLGVKGLTYPSVSRGHDDDDIDGDGYEDDDNSDDDNGNDDDDEV